jgi:predicted nucleic acid-binding protein
VLVYLDTSALAKLVVEEVESAALTRDLQDETLASSALVRTELRRAAMRSEGSSSAEHVEAVLRTLHLVTLDRQILDEAGTLPPPVLRSLDALHVVTARLLPGLDAVVTYDRRMAAACESHGLRVRAPGRP